MAGRQKAVSTPKQRRRPLWDTSICRRLARGVITVTLDEHMPARGWVVDSRPAAEGTLGMLRMANDRGDL